ncbi:MAG: hypothetical protein WA865_12870 [Spirulinaceae cyanobacterium]
MERNEIDALGSSLRRINQKLLKTKVNEKEVVKVWYQGGEPYFDLFVELQEQQVKWLQFTLRGYSLWWNEQRQRWETGKTNEMQTEENHLYPTSAIITPDVKLNVPFLELTQEILKTRTGEEIFDKMLLLFGDC